MSHVTFLSPNRYPPLSLSSLSPLSSLLSLSSSSLSLSLMECKEDHLLEAAKALILLRTTAPPDRPSPSTPKRHRLPPAVTRIENVLPVSLPPWGLRQRRSRYRGKSKRVQIEGPPSSAVTVTCSGHRSPDTPLYLPLGSDPSTSGSDGFSEIPPCKRFRAGVTYVSQIKVSAVERAPLVEEARPLSQSIKRQGRKKTLSELQTEETFLLEDKKRLMKLLEIEVIERDTALAENRRLLSELASSQRTPPPAEAEPAKLKFLLPDLNEPVLDYLPSDCDNN